LQIVKEKGAGFFTLIDPDDLPKARLIECAQNAEEGGADAILIGGSQVLPSRMAEISREIKRNITIPLIIFPGSSNQLCRSADAVLFTSLLSGRNPEFLIGEQVKGAPLVKEYGLEAIPTAYLLIESGTRTSVEYFSQTQPMPRNKPEILKAHALAAEYLGMKMIYLEAGSGAKHSVPEELIALAHGSVSLPIICGGGIRTPELAAKKVAAGADFIVIGNRFEEDNQQKLYMELAQAVHHKAVPSLGKANERS
jgi:phosphoglycerol geranylgeranyltransferase